MQRRLIAKTEEVNQKEQLIQEKEKLYIKLKAIVARQSGTDMAEPLEKYKQKIKDETNRLKKLKEDIKNYRMTIRNYELEIKRIDEYVEKLQNKWIHMMKTNSFEPANNFNQILEENQTGEDAPDEEYEENDNDNDNDNENDNENENDNDNENDIDNDNENQNQNQDENNVVSENPQGRDDQNENFDGNNLKDNREFFEFEKSKLNSV